MSFELNLKQAPPNLLSLAKKYISLRGLINAEGKLMIISFKNGFYIYKGKRWKRYEYKELEKDLIRLANENKDFYFDTKATVVQDVVKNLSAICEYPNLEQGTIIGEAIKRNCYYIPLQNEILYINGQSSEFKIKQLPHTWKLFSTNLLPFDYDNLAICPTFINFINQILNPDEVKLVQEFFGYCMIPSNLAQKFIIFYGSGANGKSCLLLILKLLLGEANVSHSPLKDFQPGSRFGLSISDGKLANIAEEIDDNVNAASGLIKQYVGGATVVVENKFKDCYSMEPTARLIFATNTLPYFRDSSDGLFRRLIVLPFEKQFLDEKIQDKRLIDKSFWSESGELSGIFNWSLEGLKRLMTNNWVFTQPSSVISVMENYKLHTNPEIQFLQDFVESDINGKVAVTELFQAYSLHCKLYGLRREEAPSFGKKIRKVFPSVIQSKNNLNVNNVRTRVWYGIRLKTNEDFAKTDISSQTKLLENINPCSVIESEEVLCASIEAPF